MKDKNSGYIFRFPLEHGLGYGYVEVLDSSDSGTWEFLAYVYNYFEYDEVCNDIEKIINSGVYMGPFNITRYPNTKGKKAWTLIGRNENFNRDFPDQKAFAGDISFYDWSKLHPWRYFKSLSFKFEEVEYEKVRHLEYVNLWTHKDSLPEKVTMKKLIEMGKKVGEYYDFSDLGNRNVFVQVINTYFSQEKVEELIKDLPPFSHT